MIHGYDDSTKEKVEVYSTEDTYSKSEVYNKEEVYDKDEVYNKSEVYNKEEAVPDSDFVLIEGSSSVGYNESKMIEYSASQLAQLGIEDMTKWMIISVTSKSSSDNIWENSHYLGSTNLTRPSAIYLESENKLRVFLYNSNPNTQTVSYRVLLKKVKN